jgi:hypothetical protein
MNAIFKQEKGADALRKLQAGPSAGGKVRVSGGAKKAGKAKKGSNAVSNVVDKLAKFTPGNKKAEKKSTTRIISKAPTFPSPGGDNKTGTTDHTSMKDFKNMMAYLKKHKKTGAKKPTAGKLSKGKK